MSRIREAILDHLADGECHSGACLADMLGMTRAGVGQQIARLRAAGWQIEGRTGQGYRLAGPGQPLRRRVIEACPSVSPEHIASAELFASIDSTSDYLASVDLPADGKARLCVAEHQTSGRGRRGRCWLAPPGGGIAFSIARSLPLSPADLTPIGLVTALAIVEAMEALGAHGLAVKWPNDIEVEGAKLGGILVDISGETDGPTRIVIGVGLNHDLGAFPEQDFGRPVTDCVRTIHGKAPQRDVMVQSLATSVARACAGFPLSGFEPYHARWAEYDSLAGCRVRLQVTPERCIDGLAAGVDADGALLLDTDRGRQRFFAGDASVRERP